MVRSPSLGSTADPCMPACFIWSLVASTKSHIQRERITNFVLCQEVRPQLLDLENKTQHFFHLARLLVVG